jgi:hypothetical protein
MRSYHRRPKGRQFFAHTRGYPAIRVDGYAAHTVDKADAMADRFVVKP